jgi:hypothetical protein
MGWLLPMLGGSHIFVKINQFQFSHRFVRTDLVLLSFSFLYLLKTWSSINFFKFLNQLVLKHANFYKCNNSQFSHLIFTTNWLLNFYFFCIPS